MALFKKNKPARQARNVRPSQERQPVFLYRQNRSERPDSLERRSIPDITKPSRIKRLLRHLPALLALAAILGSLFYLTTLSTDAKIDVNLGDRQGVVLQPDEVYQQAAQRILESSVLNRSKLTIDTKKVAETLQQQYPEIGHVAVIIPVVNRRPTFVLQPIRPVFILASNGEAFVINAAGVAVATIDELPDLQNANLLTVRDETGVRIEANKQTLSEQQTAFITTVIEQLKSKDVSIGSIVMPPNSYDLHIHISGTPYYVKFNMRENAEDQVGSYFAVRDTITPGEYIDVRVGERIYYK